MRNGSTGAPTWARKVPSGCPISNGSPTIGPARTSRAAAVSRTVRVVTKCTAQPSRGSPVSGPQGTRPRLGLEPHNPTGRCRDPDGPAAVACARDRDDPCSDNRRQHPRTSRRPWCPRSMGCTSGPWAIVSVVPSSPNSEVAERAIGIRPPRCIRAVNSSAPLTTQPLVSKAAVPAGPAGLAVEEVLEDDRDALERPFGRLPRGGRLHPVGVGLDHGTQVGVRRPRCPPAPARPALSDETSPSRTSAARPSPSYAAYSSRRMERHPNRGHPGGGSVGSVVVLALLLGRVTVGRMSWLPCSCAPCSWPVLVRPRARASDARGPAARAPSGPVHRMADGIAGRDVEGWVPVEEAERLEPERHRVRPA